MGTLNQQTHVLAGCISQVLRKCGWWESIVRGQQHTTLRAQSRASWRSEILIWEGRGSEAWTTDETHSYRKGWALWLQWLPLKSQQSQRSQGKPMRNTMKCRHFISVLCHTQKIVLCLDWCKSLHLSGLVLNADIRMNRQEKCNGKKEPIFYYCF